jgi:hypothetical protein
MFILSLQALEMNFINLVSKQIIKQFFGTGRIWAFDKVFNCSRNCMSLSKFETDNFNNESSEFVCYPEPVYGKQNFYVLI